MFKLQSVGMLKEGDRFAFVSDAPRQVNGGGGMATGNLLVVTRTAQVNRAAESCFFRYREANDPANTNHSWNGSPDAKVQLETDDAAAVAEPAAEEDETPEPARKRTPAVKLVKQKSVAPTKRATKAGTSKAVAAKKAPAKEAAAGKKAKSKADAEPADAAVAKAAKPVKPSQRLVVRSTPVADPAAGRGAAEHSSSRAKRPAMTPQLSKPGLKKSRRA